MWKSDEVFFLSETSHILSVRLRASCQRVKMPKKEKKEQRKELTKYQELINQALCNAKGIEVRLLSSCPDGFDAHLSLPRPLRRAAESPRCGRCQGSPWRASGRSGSRSATRRPSRSSNRARRKAAKFYPITMYFHSLAMKASKINLGQLVCNLQTVKHLDAINT